MALAHVILGVLNNSPCTGYEISKQFDDVLGYFWKASHQQIYRELAKLSKSNQVVIRYVEQNGKPNKKIYTISSEGEMAFNTWLKSKHKIKTNNDDVLAKLYTAHNHIKERIRILNSSRDNHVKQYEHYKSLENDFFSGEIEMSAIDKLVHMTLRKGLLIEKANIDWCDECLSAI